MKFTYSTLFLMWAILGFAQNPLPVKLDSLINASVNDVYFYQFESIKKEKEADLKLIDLYFNKDSLKTYTAKTIKNYHNQSNTPGGKGKKQIFQPDFSTYSDMEWNEYKNRLKSKYKKDDLVAFAKSDTLISPVVKQVTQLAFFDFLQKWTKMQIEEDKYVALQKKNALDATDEIAKFHQDCEKKMTEQQNQFENQYNSLKKSHEKILTDSIIRVKNKYLQAVEFEKQTQMLLDKLNITNTDYVIDNMTNEQVLEIEKATYKAKLLYQEYNLNQDTKNKISETFNRVYNLKKAIDYNKELKDIYEGRINQLSQQSLEFSGGGFSDYGFTNAQVQELNGINTKFQTYLKMKVEFNKMLITLDGKDERGKREYLNESPPQGRNYDEKKAKQKVIIEEFKTKNPYWNQYPIIVSSLKKIEVNDTNASFARYTIQ